MKAYSGAVGVIEAFHNSTIVALPDRHQDSNSSRFRIDLISQPEFAAAVNDIIIEWGNRLYQETLDRYIGGGDVPDSELNKVWRNTTVLTGMWDSPVYPQFLLAVRMANSKLPRDHRMRVLAGDPPIDWEKINDRIAYARFGWHRDESVLSVIEKEVLARHHKALLIMGGGHLLRGVQNDGPGVVDLYEAAHLSDRIFVVGITPIMNLELSSYPPESFFFTRGTWLEKLSSAHDRIIYDGLLTLSDGDRVRPTPSTYSDPVYIAELDRRWRLVRGEAFDPKKLP
ncbi:MAG TPA: hypothetical protein VFO34_12655 [Candidatus Acidoferrales bacterium]|nr:hypothetical protein [Candidatus Acidoferrales bacterium]